MMPTGEANSIACAYRPTLPRHRSGGLHAGINLNDMSEVRELLDDGLSLDLVR